MTPNGTSQMVLAMSQGRSKASHGTCSSSSRPNGSFHAGRGQANMASEYDKRRRSSGWSGSIALEIKGCLLLKYPYGEYAKDIIGMVHASER